MNDPERLPRYRLLTGPDDDTFCRRVSEALDLGYVLYGSPAVCGDGERTVAAQAVVWSGPGQPPPGKDVPSAPWGEDRPG